MKPFKSINEDLVRHKLGSFIPVFNQMESSNYFLIDGNKLGFMFVCNPSPGVYENQKDILSELYKMDFSSDTVCQVSFSRLPDLIMPLSSWTAVRGGRMTGSDKEKADLLNAYQLDYFVKSQYVPLKPHPAEPLKLRDFQVWFSFSIPLQNALPTETEHRKIDMLYSEIISKLKTMGMMPHAANAETWLYCIDKILNPGKQTRWNEGNMEVDTMRPLNEQVDVPGRKYTVEEDYFATTTNNNDPSENRYFKQLYVRKFPEYVSFGCMYELAACMSWWSTGFMEEEPSMHLS